MEIEHLTKTQIVLLTLLVAFVTSISTGIVTVSLLDQAPKTVTQTINRVVEHTVERVVPTEKSPAEAVADAVSKNEKSIVRIFAPFDGTLQNDSFFGYGVYISKDGIIMTDANVGVGFTSVGVINSEGLRLSARRLETKSSKHIHLYQLESASAAAQSVPVKFASDDSIKLGQTVVGIGGDGKKTIIASGIISGLPKNGGILNRIETSLDEKSLGAGEALFNLAGELVGFYANTDVSEPKNIFSALDVLKPEMELVTSTPAPVVPVTPATPEPVATSTPDTNTTSTSTPSTATSTAQ